MKPIASLIIIASLFTSSCSKSYTSIDGSSDKSLEESIEYLADNLEADKAKEFQAAVALIGMQEIMTLGAKNGFEELEDGEADAAIRKALDGKTVEQILSISK